MLISVITTIKDDPLGIYATIKSVINQSIFSNIEYIIVDASIKKKTTNIIVDLIKKKNIKLIKSKDNNLYRGLNMGIRASTGKYIGIINSGDIYYSHNILKYISSIISKNPSVNLIYGNLYYFNSFNIVREWNIKTQNFNTIDPLKIPHPTAFIKKDIFIKNKYYSVNYKISSDLDFFLKSKKNFDKRNFYINKYFIYMKEGGLSTSARTVLIKIFEDISILFFYYSLFFIYFYLKKVFIKIPGFFSLKNEHKLYNRFLARLIEVSRK
jgi:hypothetical protein